MHRPLTVATIVALSSIAHAQTAANPAPAQPQYTVDGTLIPADYFNNQAPRGGPTPGPVSTAFTYQGFLENAGAPANAAFDMNFVLLDDLGNVVAGPSCIDNVAVSAGIFTVQLDFGAQFDGRARRLGIAVRPGGPVGDCANPGGYTALTPAQPITATPYALGLRLPYSGVDNLPEGDVFSVTNTASSFFSSGILGVHTASPVFSFIDAAGVRGEGSGFAVAGVLGVTDNYVGVVGYGAADGATGTLGRTDGANSAAIRGIATGADSWAGYFDGRGYFGGNVGIGTAAPTAALDVVGNIRTNGLRISDNAGAGRTLVSDAQGNATWTPTGAGFIAGGTPGVTSSAAFVTQVAVITVTAGQRVHVTATQSLGSSAAGGGTGLDLWVGYRVAGSGAAPTVLGGGIFGLTVPQNQRHTFTLSGIFANLPAGTYEVGLVGRSTFNAASWNNNEWGYVTAFTLN
jgi:hypothetical protein